MLGRDASLLLYYFYRCNSFNVRRFIGVPLKSVAKVDTFTLLRKCTSDF